MDSEISLTLKHTMPLVWFVAKLGSDGMRLGTVNGMKSILLFLLLLLLLLIFQQVVVSRFLAVVVL